MDDFADELEHAVQRVETPCKAVKTSAFSTPTTRRRLPWQIDKPETSSAHGLQTPQTGHRTPNNSFAPGLATPQSGAPVTPSKHQTATPSSSAETPTPKRFKDIEEDELVRDVFGLFQKQNIQLPPTTGTDVKALLAKHSRSAEGYKKGREVSRKIIVAKEAKITELTYRIGTLEAELEAEKATVEYLRHRDDSQSVD
jgi:hypothetical protein